MVVLGGADVPQIRLHGRVVGLRLERSLVLGNLRLIVSTGIHHAGDSAEAGALSDFVCRRSGLTDYFLAQVQFVAVRTRCRGSPVRAQQHFLTAVLSVLSGF